MVKLFYKSTKLDNIVSIYDRDNDKKYVGQINTDKETVSFCNDIKIKNYVDDVRTKTGYPLDREIMHNLRYRVYG